MGVGASEPSVLRFGVFDLDPKSGELCRAGVHVKLPPQPFKVLVLLASRAGELITREEIRQVIWGDETFVDFEQGLNFCINQIRTALSDDAETPRYIETLPRRGYRFIAPVEELHPTRSGAATGVSPHTEPYSAVAGQRAIPRHHQRFIAVALAGILLLVSYFGWQRFHPAPPPAGKVMLAVLPFENLTGDTGQDYFSDGLTEEMITQLGRMHAERLGVIARTSAMQYKQTKKSTAQIGRELGVDYILEGSVRRVGDHVRISAQLIHVSDQTHLWADSYEGDLRDILVLQSAVAQVIARQIEIKLTPEQQARLARSRTVNPQAYEAYLKGRYFWNKRTEEGYKEAIVYFREALERDPAYAQAYAGLADAYALLSEGYGMPRIEAVAKARAAALKALELDGTLAEAHASLALIRMHFDWDWLGAQKEFRQAIELNPGYATAHHWYAYSLLATGLTEEALQEIQRAEESDPLSLIIKKDEAEILYFGRHYDEAIVQARKTLEMDPNFALAHRVIGWALLQKGKYAQALAELQEGLRRDPRRVDILPSLAYAYARAGRAADARRTLAQSQLKDPNSVGLEVVAVHVALGEKDAAFALLEKGFAQHSGLAVFLRTAPEFDPLRSDPRFNDLLRRTGLPANPKTARQ